MVVFDFHGLSSWVWSLNVLGVAGISVWFLCWSVFFIYICMTLVLAFSNKKFLSFTLFCFPSETLIVLVDWYFLCPVVAISICVETHPKDFG